MPCISVRSLSFRIHISQHKQVGLMFDATSLFQGPFTLGRLPLYMLVPKSSYCPESFFNGSEAHQHEAPTKTMGST